MKTLLNAALIAACVLTAGCGQAPHATLSLRAVARGSVALTFKQPARTVLATADDIACFVVGLYRNGAEVDTQEVERDGSVRFDDLSAGKYDVVVEAYDANDNLLASSQNPVQVTA